MAESAKSFLNTKTRKAIAVIVVLIVLFVIFNNLVLPWYVNQGGIVEVPSLVGIPVEQAEHILDSLHLVARKSETRLDKEHPAGTVIGQNPLAGEKVKQGRRVYVSVSGGELQVAVPSIKGRTMRDARFALEREGLRMGAVQYQPSDEFPQNTIIDQEPGPGTKLKQDAFVSVTVSQGSISQKVSVPDLTGKPFRDASTILIGAGLKLGNITYLHSPELLPNTVIEQYPRAGEMVPSGQAIDLFVVQGGETKKEILEN